MVEQFQYLKELLIEKIKREGPISFKDFMEICLYEEKFGYYSQDQIPIGKEGDFVTAPHTSKLFGYLLSVQIKECFELINNEAIFKICEFGAGTGILARDILEFFKRFHPDIYKKLEYIIVEPIQNRRKVLFENFIDHQDHLKVVEDFIHLNGFKGVLVANELFDAFPVHLIEKEDEDFFEIYVDIDDKGDLHEIRKQVTNDELIQYIDTYLKDLPKNYRTEVNLYMKKWIEDLSRIFLKGFCLIIDYGYSRKEYFADYRNRGTLLGYSRQMVTEEFFAFPGMVDMTSHVNFSDAKMWFEQYGFVCEGFCPQWAFLGGLDIDVTIEKAFGKLEPFSPVLAGVKSLIFPHGMGESHKVMVVSKDIEPRPELKGFKMKNDIERLT